jgi:hypothetical protein
MDHQQPLDADLRPDAADAPQLEITEPVRAAWQEIATWTTALSVLLYIGVFCLVMGLRLAARTYFGVSPGAGVVAFVYIILMLLPARFYWSTGARLRSGLEREESDTLERGFRSLLYAYRFAGILSIVGILASVLLFIGLALRNF